MTECATCRAIVLDLVERTRPKLKTPGYMASHEFFEDFRTLFVNSDSLGRHSPACPEWESWAGQLPHVYFIRQGTRGPIKIGISTDVQARLRGLQSANPFPLTLLHTTPGGSATEAELHGFLKDSRLQGEWFHPSDLVVSTIRGMILCDLCRDLEFSEASERAFEILPEAA